MSITKFAVAFAAISLVAGSAFAGTSVVGSWKGKLKFDVNKALAGVPPDKKQMAEQQFAMFSKMSFGLTLSKNGTYWMKISGIPPQAGKEPPAQTGTWSIKGDQLSLTQTASNPQMKPPAHVFTVAKGGKSFSAPQGPGGVAVITFNR